MDTTTPKSAAARRHVPWRVAAIGIVTAYLAAAFLTTTIAGSSLLLLTLSLAVPAPSSLPSAGDQAIVVLTGRLERGNKAAQDHAVSGLPIYAAGDPVGGMAAYMQAHFGVKATWIDKDSIDTRTNASVAACVLIPQGIRSIALVTDVWHMARSELWFRRYGFNVTPTPVEVSSWPSLTNAELGSRPQGVQLILPSGLGRARAQVAIHEWAGLLEYALAPAILRATRC